MRGLRRGPSEDLTKTKQVALDDAYGVVIIAPGMLLCCVIIAPCTLVVRKGP